MTSVIVIEKKIEAILKYSTPIGYVNHAVLFFGRFCTINLLTSLHSDDLREWKCDTQQPGCNQICNNHFSPMSHVRFFNLQIIILTFPRLAFYFFTNWAEARSTEKKKEEKKKYDEEKKKYDDMKKKYDEEKDDTKHLIEKPKEPEKPPELKKKKKIYLAGNQVGKAVDVIWTRRIARYYLIHLIVMLAFEIGGFWLLNFLQMFQHNQQFEHMFMFSAFRVPEEYYCKVERISGNACKLDDGSIPCFNPRAYDKTIYLWYHLTMVFFSMLLLVIDIIYTVQYQLRKVHRRQKEKAANRDPPKDRKLNNYVSNSNSSIQKSKKQNFW